MQTGAYVSAAIMQMFPNGVRPGRARAAGVGAVAECGVWWLSPWRLARRENNAHKTQSEEASGAAFNGAPAAACTCASKCK